MLQSIKRGHALEPNHPDFHKCLVRFVKAVRDAVSSDTTPGSIRAVLLQWMEPTLGGLNADPVKINNDFLTKNSTSIPHRLAG